MLQLLIMSDSHGLTDEITKIKNRHNLQYNIHCGDSELPYDAKQLEPFITVAGNCDYLSSLNNEEIVELDGFTILVTHGHLYGVKSDLQKLAYRAEEVGAHIVFFGHSHLVHAEKYNDMLLVNPGSISLPRGRKEKTYLIMTLKEDRMVNLQYYDVDTGKPIDGLKFNTFL